MKNIFETLNNINLKETVQRALVENGAQVVQCERWLDLEYSNTGNTYNNNAPLVIQIKTIQAADESQTIAFLTFHNGGDPRGNYETDTYILQGDQLYEDTTTIYSGEGGTICYNWNTGATEYQDGGECWTIDPMSGKIYHTDGDQAAPVDILKAIIDNIYLADFDDFSLDNE